MKHKPVDLDSVKDAFSVDLDKFLKGKKHLDVELAKLRSAEILPTPTPYSPVNLRTKVKHKLVRDTRPAKALSAYLVLHPNGRHIGTLHLYYSNRDSMRLDLFENGLLTYQYQGDKEDYPFSSALSGVILAEIRLFAAGTRISTDGKPIKDFESNFYRPGLDRLKALGYQVVKAI